MRVFDVEVVNDSDACVLYAKVRFKVTVVGLVHYRGELHGW